jgi:hypothetical protein
MDIALGDRIVVAATRPCTASRAGTVVGLHHADGTPPFDVLWSDTGQTTVFYPGPDTVVIPADRTTAPAAVPRPA